MRKITLAGAAALAATALATAAQAADEIFVGHLADLTGPTASVSKPFSQGVADALAYINAHGGVGGTKITVDTVDYSYQVPRAMAQYKKWSSEHKIAAIQGWGTGDTEALVATVTKDQIPYISGSYSGHLTDPVGKTSAKAAPYNFFYGPSYTDGCRGLVDWAMADWKKKGGQGQPKFVHMGDNHPYPNSPKDGCGAYAKEKGFQIVNPIQYSLNPGDFKAQCLSLKETGANYAYLANTAGSTIALLKSCETVGTKAQFMGNIWGMDEAGMKAAGEAANGMVWVVAAATWKDDVPGMKLVREISRISDPDGKEERAVHYMRGVCSAYYMKEAMDAAATMEGGVTGPNVKQGMYKKDHWVPAGLEGVCLPSTWKADDHRGSTQVMVYQAEVKGTSMAMHKVYSTELPRRPEWLGW